VYSDRVDESALLSVFDEDVPEDAEYFDPFEEN